MLLIINGERDKRSFKFFSSYRIAFISLKIAVDWRCPVIVPVTWADSVDKMFHWVHYAGKNVARVALGDPPVYHGWMLSQTEVDDTTSVPTSKLSSTARSYFAAAGVDVSDVAELTSSQHRASVTQLIQAGIDAANHNAVSRAQLIQKWTIVPRDFSIAGGELGECRPIFHSSN